MRGGMKTVHDDVAAAVGVARFAPVHDAARADVLEFYGRS
jgi:hypothetical protein